MRGLTGALVAAVALVAASFAPATAQQGAQPAAPSPVGVVVPAQTATDAPPSAVDSGAALVNDYPTEARADYVFVCMATNGQTRESLRRCSCSIDVIASILPYEKYVDAETVLAMRQVAGERVGVLRSAAVANDFVSNLRRAQAEGDVRCF